MRRRGAVLSSLAVAVVASTAGWLSTRGSGAPPERPYGSDGHLLQPVPAPHRPPNLVLVVVDTLRADALDPEASSAASGGETAMPFLAGLAAEGVFFRQASAPAPWTMPSVASLLTGLPPSEHRANDSRNPIAMSHAVTTYAEVLSHAYGYDTAAFVDSPWFGGPEALAQGFAQYHEGFCLHDAPSRLARWLDVRGQSDRPYFLLLHSTEPHEPYGPENHRCPVDTMPSTKVALHDDALDEPWELARTFFLDRGTRRALVAARPETYLSTVYEYMFSGYARNPRPDLARELRAAYVRGTRHADDGLRALVSFLRARGELENTVVVVTSDHGEAFGEHGLLGHGRGLQDELLRIPLVLWGADPLRGGKVVEESVGLVDVLPTFFDLAGLAPLPDVDGRSLLPVIDGQASGWPVVAEELVHFGTARVATDVLLRSVRSDQWKYVIAYDFGRGTVHEELYDLLLDRDETTNLADGGHGLLRLDERFCASVERVRDGVWKAIRAHADERLGAAGPLGSPGAPARPPAFCSQ